MKTLPRGKYLLLLVWVPMLVKGQCDELRTHSAKSMEGLIQFVEANEADVMTCLELDSFVMYSFKKFLVSYSTSLDSRKPTKVEKEKLVIDSAYSAFNKQILQSRTYSFLRMVDEPKMRLINLPISASEKRLHSTLQHARFSDEETRAFVGYWKKHRKQHKSMEELYGAYTDYQRTQEELAEEERKKALTKGWELESVDGIGLLHDIPYFEDLEPAQACARAMGRPMVICFSGYTVVNGRKMEERVMSNEDIQKLLREDYILVLLMVDYRKLLPKDQQRTEVFEGETFEVKTYGDQWALLELRMLNDETQPTFVKTTADLVQIGNVIKYTSSIPDFRAWLVEGQH